MKTNSVLVRRRAAIGDVIMTTGIVRELKFHHPEAHVAVATDYPEVFKNNPYVDSLVGIEEDPKNYEVSFNLDDVYEVKPTENLVNSYYSAVFGSAHRARWSELFLTHDDTVRPRELIDRIPGEYIVIHMRNWHWPMKNVDPQIWLQVLLGLFNQRDDHSVVFVGGATDHVFDLPMTYDARGFTLHENCDLIQKAALFIGGDSAPFHIAACTDTPILGLLTHLMPEQIMPFRKNSNHDRAILSTMPCVGCYGRQPTPVRYVRCDHGDYRCNSHWDVDKIVTTMLEML